MTNNIETKNGGALSFYDDLTDYEEMTNKQNRYIINHNLQTNLNNKQPSGHFASLIHNLLVYADNIHLFVDNMRASNKNIEIATTKSGKIIIKQKIKADKKTKTPETLNILTIKNIDALSFTRKGGSSLYIKLIPFMFSKFQYKEIKIGANLKATITFYELEQKKIIADGHAKETFFKEGGLKDKLNDLQIEPSRKVKDGNKWKTEGFNNKLFGEMSFNDEGFTFGISITEHNISIYKNLIKQTAIIPQELNSCTTKAYLLGRACAIRAKISKNTEPFNYTLQEICNILALPINNVEHPRRQILEPIKQALADLKYCSFLELKLIDNDADERKRRDMPTLLNDIKLNVKYKSKEYISEIKKEKDKKSKAIQKTISYTERKKEQAQNNNQTP